MHTQVGIHRARQDLSFSSGESIYDHSMGRRLEAPERRAHVESGKTRTLTALSHRPDLSHGDDHGTRLAASDPQHQTHCRRGSSQESPQTRCALIRQALAPARRGLNEVVGEPRARRRGAGVVIEPTGLRSWASREAPPRIQRPVVCGRRFFGLRRGISRPRPVLKLP